MPNFDAERKTELQIEIITLLEKINEDGIDPFDRIDLQEQLIALYEELTGESAPQGPAFASVLQDIINGKFDASGVHAVYEKFKSIVDDVKHYIADRKDNFSDYSAIGIDAIKHIKDMATARKEEVLANAA